MKDECVSMHGLQDEGVSMEELNDEKVPIGELKDGGVSKNSIEDLVEVFSPQNTSWRYNKRLLRCLFSIERLLELCSPQKTSWRSSLFKSPLGGLLSQEVIVPKKKPS